ncbi:MAG: hypothetical protein IKP86_12350 [Anaerolineaceae bacterium]|nr:hypothetical protein [Anaerolineaceae bacterium]
MALFEPAWKTNKEEKLDDAMIALRAIDDPKKLRDVAMTALLPEVRLEAVSRITDEQLLLEIVVGKETNFDARKAAVRKINDENILAEIAVQRSAYPADGEAIAKLENVELLKKIAMSETGWEQAKAVYKITDQRILKEIALKGEKGDARKTAIRCMTDPGELLDIMAGSSERFIISEAFKRFDELLRQRPDDAKTEEWHDRYLDIVVKEEHKDAKVNLDYFQRYDELDRIYHEAVREDLRAEAFSRSIAGCIFSPHNLKEATKQAFMDSLRIEDGMENPWKKILENLETRILNSHDPSIFLEVVEDPDAGCKFAAACIRELFGDRFQYEVGIDWVQDEAVAAYIGNLEKYQQLQNYYDMDYCLRLLADAVPKEHSENKWYKRFLRRVEQ